MGYYTAAFINNGNLRAGKGFEQGFIDYKNFGDKKVPAEGITASVLNFLNDYRNNKPFLSGYIILMSIRHILLKKNISKSLRMINYTARMINFWNCARRVIRILLQAKVLSRELPFMRIGIILITI